ncbi:MAG: hypothetical protein Tsb009_22450 [Planctomycetaceae bacterium]
MSTDPLLAELIGQPVVLDVASRYVYLGTLAERGEHYFILANADVHDLRDTSTTRELYVIEAKRHGIHPNREKVFVRVDEVVSLSALDDVMA